MKKLFAFMLTLAMLVSMSAMTAVSAYADDGEKPREFWCTVNEYTSWSLTEREGYAVLTVLTVDGSVPPGMYYEIDNLDRLILSGTPYAAGDYRVTFSMDVTEHPDADGADVWGTGLTCIFHVEGNAAPVITKQPTGETIVEGGRDSFIAKADNATRITWRFVSPDTRTTIKASEGPSYFAGLQVSGTDKEQLVVSNVPLSLDGWAAEAMFENAGGTVYSNGAVIRVKRAELKAPVINTPPADANLKPGENITLTVSASSPDGNRLSYQWYKATKEGETKGEAIPGATSASYTVNYEEGTFYYYCMVYNNRDGDVSAPARTSSAKVVGAAAPTPAPSAKPTPTPAPSAQPTEAPKETAAPEKPAEKAEKADHTVAFIIGGVAAVAIICATLIIIQRGAAKRYPERYSEQIRRADEYRKSHRHTNDK